MNWFSIIILLKAYVIESKRITFDYIITYLIKSEWAITNRSHSNTPFSCKQNPGTPTATSASRRVLFMASHILTCRAPARQHPRTSSQWDVAVQPTGLTARRPKTPRATVRESERPRARSARWTAEPTRKPQRSVVVWCRAHFRRLPHGSGSRARPMRRVPSCTSAQVRAPRCPGVRDAMRALPNRCKSSTSLMARAEQLPLWCAGWLWFRTSFFFSFE
jgi:hypothetical protein